MMQNVTRQTYLLLNALLNISASNNHWSDHTAEKFKALENQAYTYTTIRHITIHQEHNLQCEARIFMHNIHFIAAFDADNCHNTLMSDVTGKSDTEINETARYLFEKIKDEHKKSI